MVAGRGKVRPLRGNFVEEGFVAEEVRRYAAGRAVKPVTSFFTSLVKQLSVSGKTCRAYAQTIVVCHYNVLQNGANYGIL